MQSIKTKEVTLLTPIVVEGETVETITMREAIVNDLLEAADMAGPNASNARHEACLLAQLTDIPFNVFIGMPEANYYQLGEAYSQMGKPESVPVISGAPVSSSASTPGSD